MAYESQPEDIMVERLFHSVYKGSGWSEPQEILKGHRLFWLSKDGNIAVDREDRIHIVVPALLHDGYDLVYLRSSDDEWEEQRMGVHATIATISHLQNDSLLVVYSGFPTTLGSHNSHGIYYLRSQANGTSWDGPTFLATTELGLSTKPITVQRNSGEVHILWTAGDPGATSGYALEHWHLRKRSSDWQRMPSVQLKGKPVQVRAAVDRDDRVIALVELYDGIDLISMSEFDWETGSPRRTPLFPELLVAMNPSLEQDGQRLVMAWSALEAETGPFKFLVSSRCATTD